MKKLYTPVHPSFAIQKWSVRGYSLHGFVFVMHMSRVRTNPAFCICENKDADQRRGNREADQRLCVCFTDNTIPLLPKSDISNL